MDIFVFFGKPGCGKTTLITNLFIQEEIIDALDFLKTYEVNGKISEEKTICAYEDTYNYLNSFSGKRLVVEFGTSHPEYNLQKLTSSSQSHNLHIFLCDASYKTCFDRATKRSRKMDQVALSKRLDRDFPNTHQKLFDKSSLKYTLLDMEKPLEDNTIIIKNLLKKIKDDK